MNKFKKLGFIDYKHGFFPQGAVSAAVLKKICEIGVGFLRRPFGLPTSQGRGGLGCMDSTLALGAFRIEKGRGRRSGGREREPRRAGEGRLVWNREDRVLSDHPS